MNTEAFLDTNILVYAFDKTAPQKQEIARRLLIGGERWAISWQVVQEFCSVALHRFVTPLQADELREVLDLLLLPHCLVLPSEEIYRDAVRLQTQTQYRFYDSLIVAGALATGARVLYSEDLQHNRRFDKMVIKNPFVS